METTSTGFIISDSFNLEHGISISAKANLVAYQVEKEQAYKDKITAYMKLSPKNIDAICYENETEETRLFDRIKKDIQDWTEVAEQTQLISIALTLNNYPEPTHTANEWISDKQNNLISNRAYKLCYDIDERNRYNHSIHKDEKIWYVSWWFSCNNSNVEYHETIASVNRKPFATKEDADKYLEGRKKAYAKYFSGINPTIPQEHRHYFQFRGIDIPGYIFEE